MSWNRLFIGGPKHGEYAPAGLRPRVEVVVGESEFPIHNRAKALPGDPTHAIVMVTHYYRLAIVQANPETGAPHYVHQSLTDAQALKLALKSGIPV